MAEILIEWGMDIDTVVAGVLHDTVEDTDATLDELESLFGRDVAFLVDGVTKVRRKRQARRTAVWRWSKRNVSLLFRF